MNRKKLIISTILNAISFACFLFVLFYHTISHPGSLMMFTVQSNILCGIVSLIVVIFNIFIFLEKKNELPSWLKVAKMVTTASVGLTFFTVTLYLGFVAIAEGYSYFILFRNENFFYHFLSPVCAMVSFIFFDSGKTINFKLTFLNVIHMIGYAIFYSINVFTHLEDGKVSRKYDWYYFVLGENWTIIFVIVGVLIFTYGIGFGLWILNKKFNKEKTQEEIAGD